jgi:hypothetical protein
MRFHAERTESQSGNRQLERILHHTSRPQGQPGQGSSACLNRKGFRITIVLTLQQGVRTESKRYTYPHHTSRLPGQSVRSSYLLTVPDGFPATLTELLPEERLSAAPRRSPRTIASVVLPVDWRDRCGCQR